jgi:hypothetical protein
MVCGTPYATRQVGSHHSDRSCCGGCTHFGAISALYNACNRLACRVVCWVAIGPPKNSQNGGPRKWRVSSPTGVKHGLAIYPPYKVVCGTPCATRQIRAHSAVRIYCDSYIHSGSMSVLHNAGIRFAFRCAFGVALPPHKNSENAALVSGGCLPPHSSSPNAKGLTRPVGRGLHVLHAASFQVPR